MPLQRDFHPAAEPTPQAPAFPHPLLANLSPGQRVWPTVLGGIPRTRSTVRLADAKPTPDATEDPTGHSDAPIFSRFRAAPREQRPAGRPRAPRGVAAADAWTHACVRVTACGFWPHQGRNGCRGNRREPSGFLCDRGPTHKSNIHHTKRR